MVICYFVKPVIFGTLVAKFPCVPKRTAMLEGLGCTFTRQPEDESIKQKQKVNKVIQATLHKLSIPLLRLIVLNPLFVFVISLKI